MNQLKALWKYLLSFRKTEWSFKDYPVRIKTQTQGPNVPKYCAQIINWWNACGLGETKTEALDDLERWLSRFKEGQGFLWRPGTKVPTPFASTTFIDAHRPLAEEFLQKVFDFGPSDPVIITDMSSLYDFEGINDDMDIERKIREVYGIDVTDIEDRSIARILQRIEENRR